MTRALAAIVALTAACSPPPPPKIAYQGAHWTGQTVLKGIGSGAIAVANSDDDTLSILSSDKLETAATIPIGLNPIEFERPRRVASSPDGRFLYVTLPATATATGGHSGVHGSVTPAGLGTTDGQVLKIRTSDGQLEARVRVDPNPADILVSADGKRLYVSHYDLNRIAKPPAGGDQRSRIAIIDAEQMVVTAGVLVCMAPGDLAFTPDGSRLLVACNGDDRVAIVRIEDPQLPVTLVAMGPAPGIYGKTLNYGPWGVAVDADGTRAYVSCRISQDIRQLDLATQTLRPEKIVTGGSPRSGARIGSQVFFARPSGYSSIADDHLFVLAGGAVVAEHIVPSLGCVSMVGVYPVPNQPRKVFLLCASDGKSPGTIVQFDLDQAQPDTWAAVGFLPEGAAVTPPPR